MRGQGGRSKRRLGNALSELEGCVLGLVWRGGPCTPYAVRCALRASPSPHWGHSAGSIYPIFRRLERDGRVAAEPHATGARRSLRYRITPSGRAALRRWLGPAVSVFSASLPPDPLRTRVAFLGALDPPDRAQFLKEAEARILAQMEDAAGYARAADDPWSRLVSDGARATLHARLEWIRRARRALDAG